MLALGGSVTVTGIVVFANPHALLTVTAYSPVTAPITEGFWLLVPGLKAPVPVHA